MKIFIELELNLTKEQLEELCEEEEIVGGWKALIEKELKLNGLDSMKSDHGIEARIIKIEEKENQQVEGYRIRLEGKWDDEIIEDIIEMIK